MQLSHKCLAYFAGYWAVDAKEETAMNGTWKKGPGTELFAALERASLFLTSLASRIRGMMSSFLMLYQRYPTRSAGSEDVWQLNHVVRVLNCFKCETPLAGARSCAHHSSGPGHDTADVHKLRQSTGLSILQNGI